LAESKERVGVAVMAAPDSRNQSAYCTEMMERLGIEPGRGAIPQASLGYIAAFHRCQACPFKQACRNWLDDAAASIAAAPRFCPNADIFFELQFDQPGYPPAAATRPAC
jgi:hypothetical protein